MSPAEVAAICEEHATVTPKIAFAMLGISPWSGYPAIKRGEIPTISAGRTSRVPTSYIRQALGIHVAARKGGRR